MTPILLEYDRLAARWIAIADVVVGAGVVRVCDSDTDSATAERKVRRQIASLLT
jgi:hypothetical protein